MTREQDQKLGPEVLGLRNNWEQFIMKDGILMQKWHTPDEDDYPEIIAVPQVTKRSVLEQLRDSKVTGEHFALHKTLSGRCRKGIRREMSFAVWIPRYIA